METVLDRIRNGAASLDDDIMTALFKSVDLLRLTLDEIRSSTYAGIDSREITDLFSRWLDVDKNTRTSAARVRLRANKLR